MNIGETHVYGFKMAFAGMRNPMRSHHLSDSNFDIDTECVIENNGFEFVVPEVPILGRGDTTLALALIAAHEPHCKFLRQIQIWTEFDFPRYIWQDIDTYKVATVRNSESSRHTPKKRDFVKSDFDCDTISDSYLEEVNRLRRDWVDNGNMESMLSMKKMLPESFRQKAHYTMSYSTALNILLQRMEHPLPEFNIKVKGSICQWLVSLPYMKIFAESYIAGSIKRGKMASKRLGIIEGVLNED